MGTWCTWPQLGLFQWTQNFFISLRCSQKWAASPEAQRKVRNKQWPFTEVNHLLTVLQISSKTLWTSSVTEGKVNTSDNTGNKPECTKTGWCASCITQMLSQSVVKANYKTGMSKGGDILLVTQPQISVTLPWSNNCMFLCQYLPEDCSRVSFSHIQYREHFYFSIPVLFLLFLLVAFV